MKLNSSKTMASSIALFLTLAMMIPIAALPLVSAQAATMKTYPFIDAVPNPVGVGEDLLIRFGISEALGSVEQGWTGITVTMTKPDNTTETLGPFTTDSTGGSIKIYKPAQVGTYKLKTNFPEQAAPGTWFVLERGTMIFEGTIMKASTSETMDLVVQENPLPGYPTQPLPIDYWWRPIDPQLREWYTISGNWMNRPDNSLALNNDDAPETGHVLWAKPLTTGGLTGGLWGPGQVPASSETGDAYEGKFPDSVILNGVLYYNRMPAAISGNPYPQWGILAVDLHTGKELWFRNNTRLSFGQILYFNSFNYDGVYTYLWDASGPVWNAYDPFNGEWLYSMTNVPQGTRTFGPSGEILIYQVDYANRWMALWNSTDCAQQASGSWAEGSLGSWARNIQGQTWNGSNPKSYTWNVSIPAGLQAGLSFFAPILKVFPDRVMSVAFNQTQVRVWALSTNPTTKGTLLFDKTWSAPSEWLEGSNTLHYVGATNEVENGVIAVWSKELRKHYGFSTETGEFLWETDSEHFLDWYGWGNVEHTWYFAYGKLFSVGVGGIVYAYDLQTGDTVWTYTMSDAYNEPVTGNNWWGWITMIADGKVYVGTVEHSAEMPIPRGGPYICIDAETGDEVWRVNGMYRQTRWGGCAIMGDSIIATMDTYDQRIYAVGKGPSAVTVEAPMTAMTLGSSLVIRGTVMDVSPGTKSDEMSLRFPNGIPAVADESMSDWMLYVYKQFARPTNAAGVPVSIDVIDANGNHRNIGTATTDSSGFFSFMWTPDITGKYTVIASFAGSKAYYGSYAETAFGVVDAIPPEPMPEQAIIPPLDLYILYAAIGIIAAIVIVGVLILRKK